MNQLKVPIDKSDNFSIELFRTINSAISELQLEYSIVPNKILFQGNLGRELFNIIINNNWELSKFNPECIEGPNRIVIKYLDTITQSSLNIPSTIVFPDKINGFMTSNTATSIMSKYASTNFSIERTVRPEIVVYLYR